MIQAEDVTRFRADRTVFVRFVALLQSEPLTDVVEGRRSGIVGHGFSA